MGWQDREKTKKGNIGEKIAREYLEDNGYIVYECVTPGMHGFDKMVSKGCDNIFICEVKTKAKRNFYPDTGIDYRHYIKYKKIRKKHNLPVYVMFIDEMLGQIYGDWLSKLEKKQSYDFKGKKLEYPMYVDHGKRKIIYFYQPSMKVISYLTNDQIEAIKNHECRSYNYKQPCKPKTD